MRNGAGLGRETVTPIRDGASPIGSDPPLMGDGERGIEIAVLIGSPDTSGPNINLMLPGITTVVVRTKPSKSGSLWSSLGFASKMEFESVQHQVDLVIKLSPGESTGTGGIDQIAGILEHACGMDATVMLAAIGNTNLLHIVRHMPICEWLGARILFWRRLSGGVAISHGKGVADCRAACVMAELMSAAGMGGVVSGVECLAMPGPVAIPVASPPVILVGAPGMELGERSLSENSSLVAADLGDARLREVPMYCFWSCANLTLVGLPDECVVIRDVAFADCAALKGIDLENVESLEICAFEGCANLSHIGAVSRIRSISDLALQAMGAIEFRFESISHVGTQAFMGSGLRVFSGRVEEWDSRPFDNCRDLQLLEMWPGRGFDPLQLVGRVPGQIRFHGGSGDANGMFSILLQGSGTPMVLTTDTAQIIGGPGSALARRTKPLKNAVTSVHLLNGTNIAVKELDLSGLLPGSLHCSLRGWMWVETVTLPTWLERLPANFFYECRSLRAVNLEE
jgi:hypothetical protein